MALSAVAGGVLFFAGEAKAFFIKFDSQRAPLTTLYDATYGAQWPGGGVGLLAPPGPPVANPPIALPLLTRQWYDTNIQRSGNNYLFPTDKRIWFVDDAGSTNATTGNGGPSAGSGNIEWTWEDVNGNGDWRIPPDPHSVDKWVVDVDFNPNYGPGAAPSIFEYVVQIEDRSIDYPLYLDSVPPPRMGNQYFEDVTLVTAADDISSTVKKEVYTALWNGNDYIAGTLLGVLTTAGAGSAHLDLTPFHISRLFIRDIATPNGGQIDNYSNRFRQGKVPAPLPLLGIGAAFGSVRKMRKFSSQLRAFSMG
ncbi:MAG: hypothetical protein VKO39_10130 [Cyanobacteriota bacterium]|nr:hypothetical protein [Cyanobacteriota bacterium]